MTPEIIRIRIKEGESWKELPPPSKYKVTFEDLDSEASKRYITTGRMKRSRIVKNIMKISITYNLLTMAKTSETINLVSEKSMLEVQLYNVISKSTETRTFYTASRSYEVTRMFNGEYKSSGLAFDLVEC